MKISYSKLLAFLSVLLFLLTLALPFSIAQAEEVTLINAGTVGITDLPTSSARSITLDIQDARFSSRSVGRLKLQANGIDFKQGVLQSLKADMINGHFDNNIKVDEFIINTNSFSFDTLELLSHQRFILDQPVTAQVELHISEENLQNFFAHPKTVTKLEQAIRKKTGGMDLIRFSNPTLDLLGGEKIRMNLMVVVGQAIAAPITIEGQMKIKRQKLMFRDLKVTSSDTALPVDIASAIQSQLNKLVDLEKLGAKNNFVILARSVKGTKHKVSITGLATMTRLEFGSHDRISKH